MTLLQEDEIPRIKVNEHITVFGDTPLSLAQIAAFWQACGANPQSDEMDRDTGFVSRRAHDTASACTAPWAASVRSWPLSRPRFLA